MYRGDCRTCLQMGPSSQPDKEGTVSMVDRRRGGTKASYYGETSRSVYVRGQQHLTAMYSPEQHKDNAFVKHRKNYHKGEEEDV